MNDALNHAEPLEVEPGVWSVLIEGRSYEVRLAGDEVFIGPWRTGIGRRKRGSSTGDETGRAVISAPMPGKIVRVLVSAGDEVTVGQGIVVVEAMKMQNEMKAPRAGRIKSISVSSGDTVIAGATLAEIE